MATSTVLVSLSKLIPQISLAITVLGIISPALEASSQSNGDAANLLI